jgi:hypothetical protein
MSLQQIVLISICIVCMLSVFLTIQHERKIAVTEVHSKNGLKHQPIGHIVQTKSTPLPVVVTEDPQAIDAEIKSVPVDPETENKGVLTCDGKQINSEVIYWKIVPGDDTYESPITPHHELHHDRYTTYEYDEGGWNNIRMSLECTIVFTHAMGRTLVSPPRQNLYLLDKKHKDKKGKEKTGMGFEDFFDLDLLKSHKGYHIITSQQFLAKEGVSGGLHGVLPPKNDTHIGGRKCIHVYLFGKRVAHKPCV